MTGLSTSINVYTGSTFTIIDSVWEIWDVFAAITLEMTSTSIKVVEEVIAQVTTKVKTMTRAEGDRVQVELGPPRKLPSLPEVQETCDEEVEIDRTGKRRKGKENGEYEFVEGECL
ncbi:hypothetical protein ACH5RR_009105 [Cinchona calisaya]|uniref:Uncharacterized protein n=1 Tax=Cinchona calisaya TaxID=153742 RepID=A0ABD3ADZ9_9GENT